MQDETQAQTRNKRVQLLAERHPPRAVRLARRALERASAAGPAELAELHYTLGWALLCWERFDEARAELRQAWAAFRAAGATRLALRCRYALCQADLTQFAPRELEQQFGELAEQFERLGARDDADRSRMSLAILLNVQGRPIEAEALLAQVAPTRPLDQARLLRIRASAAIASDDGDRGKQLLDEAERLFSLLGHPLDAAKCWFEQGWRLLRRDELGPALHELERADQVFARFDLSLRRAYCAKTIGLLLTRRGLYDKALAALLAALERFTALERTGEIGGCQLNLGNIYYYTARWEAALACYTRAAALYAAAGIEDQALLARRNQAMVYREQQRHAEASAILEAIEPLAASLGLKSEQATIWCEQAGLLADDGQIDQAERLLERAHQLFSQVGGLLGVADCLLDRGELALRRHEVDRAQSLFESASPLIALHPYNQWRTDYGLGRCHERRGRLSEALAHYRAATATVAALRGRLANEEISSSLYLQASQLYHDALRVAVALGAHDALLEIGEQQRAVVLRRLLSAQLGQMPPAYQEEYNALRLQISRLTSGDFASARPDAQHLDETLARYADLLVRARHGALNQHSTAGALSAPDFNLALVRAQLAASYGDDWTALYYTFCGDTLLVAIITSDGLAVESIAYDDDLRDLVARASQPGYQRLTYRDLPYHLGHAARRWETLERLAGRLLPAPALARLHPDHRLLIVPAGALHAIAWAALRVGPGWLIERAIVHVAPSLSAWQSIGRATWPGAALLVGCSAFGGRADPLPGVEAEVAAVAARWPSASQQVQNERATRAALLEWSASGALASYGLIHIASHAQLVPAHGWAAHVKLWDDDLLLSEVADLRLDGALVTLSACDGAASVVLPGEEILSLNWAFLAAGASAVLASLWPVYDQAALRLMLLFYEALRTHGDGAAALAQAQRQQIAVFQQHGDGAAAPDCWASFVVTGGRV